VTCLSPIVFSRLVNYRHLLRGVTRSLTRFGTRWPDSSETNPISVSFRDVLIVIPPRHIIQELQKENANAAHQNKLLESENKLLLTETGQLRQVNRLNTTHSRRSLIQSCRA
jgi:hypothetical protein